MFNTSFTYSGYTYNYMLNKNTLGVNKCKAKQKQHCNSDKNIWGYILQIQNFATSKELASKLFKYLQMIQYKSLVEIFVC